jgi:hypothetical protein
MTDKPDVFERALFDLGMAHWSVLAPQPFQIYAQQGGHGALDTARHISVDTWGQLPRALRKESVMVFRLGSPDGERHTFFSLVRAAPERLRDFFLFDADIFPSVPVSTFLPEAGMRDLFPYFVLPELTEGSLVHLAFASGLISHALGLERPASMAAPATGASTYSFLFQPHSKVSEKFEHRNGQVEVDALFIGRRGGRDILFVVEAKARRGGPSLAKHKLVYPVLALAPRVPADMEIVPVYLRAFREQGVVWYMIAECEFPDPRKVPACLDMLRVKSAVRLALPTLVLPPG